MAQARFLRVSGGGGVGGGSRRRLPAAATWAPRESSEQLPPCSRLLQALGCVGVQRCRCRIGCVPPAHRPVTRPLRPPRRPPHLCSAAKWTARASRPASTPTTMVPAAAGERGCSAAGSSRNSSAAAAVLPAARCAECSPPPTHTCPPSSALPCPLQTSASTRAASGWSPASTTPSEGAARDQLLRRERAGAGCFAGRLPPARCWSSVLRAPTSTPLQVRAGLHTRRCPPTQVLPRQQRQGAAGMGGWEGAAAAEGWRALCTCPAAPAAALGLWPLPCVWRASPTFFTHCTSWPASPTRRPPLQKQTIDVTTPTLGVLPPRCMLGRVGSRAAGRGAPRPAPTRPSHTAQRDLRHRRRHRSFARRPAAEVRLDKEGKVAARDFSFSLWLPEDVQVGGRAGCAGGPKGGRVAGRAGHHGLPAMPPQRTAGRRRRPRCGDRAETNAVNHVLCRRQVRRAAAIRSNSCNPPPACCAGGHAAAHRRRSEGGGV